MKRLIATAAALAIMSGAAYAHGKKKHNEAQAEPPEMVENEFGKTGDPAAVTQTISMVMSDEMTFTPNVLKVAVGDTIRFIVENTGEDLHEMVLGRTEDLKKHAKMMVEFPEMEHEEPYMAHVEAGEKGEIVWTFSKAGQFEFGCLIPGHYDAGMRGTIIVQ